MSIPVDGFAFDASIREWDFHRAPPAEVGSFLATLQAVLAADLPADPPWLESEMRNYLAETVAGERRTIWVVESGRTGRSGRKISGFAGLLPFGDVGVIDVVVHPALRRGGLGEVLVGAVSRRAYREGLPMIGAEAVSGTPSIPFFESMGFELEHVETRDLLTLSAVNWAAFTTSAGRFHAGYRIDHYSDGPPKDLLESCSQIKRAARLDRADLSLLTRSFDPQRRRHTVEAAQGFSRPHHVVLAIHERTGVVAALSEAAVSARQPETAYMCAAIVLSDHCDAGIDRVVSERMLLELRATEPWVRQVQSWNVQHTETESRNIAELGFASDRGWREYGADTPYLNHMYGASVMYG